MTRDVSSGKIELSLEEVNTIIAWADVTVALPWHWRAEADALHTKLINYREELTRGV